MPTHYIASAGEIDVVEILEEGTGGIQTTFIPKNPVVVSLVRMGYTFIASKDHLFEDRTKAIEEAHRLRQEELEKERNARELMKKTRPRPLSLVRRMGTPNLPISVNIEQGATTEESPKSAIDETPVSATCKQAATTSKHSKPKDLVENMQMVIGSDTVTLRELYDRLRGNGLMPLTSDPIEFIRYHLSKNRDLFDRPDRTTVCLFAGNPYLVKASPVLPIIEQDSSIPEVSPVEEVPPPEVPPVVEGAQATSIPEETAADKAKLDSYRIWNGKQLDSISLDSGRYEDPSILMIEQKRGGSWVCSITLTGISQVFTGAPSKRRDIARIWAGKKLRVYINQLNLITYRIGIPQKGGTDV